jgi:hypothetical protein
MVVDGGNGGLDVDGVSHGLDLCPRAPALNTSKGIEAARAGG